MSKQESVVHIAELEVRIGPLQRQLCAWCGERPVDNDLRNVASTDGAAPLFWPVNGLVEVTSGNPTHYTALLHPEDGKYSDNGCCPIESRRPKLSVVSTSKEGA